jgi:hypothetical protein
MKLTEREQDIYNSGIKLGKEQAVAEAKEEIAKAKVTGIRYRQLLDKIVAWLSEPEIWVRNPKAPQNIKNIINSINVEIKHNDGIN